MLQSPTVIHKCIAIKDSQFRWLSFIEGNLYSVHEIKYSSGEIDKTHVAVDGLWRMKDGRFESRKIPVAKELCKEYLKKYTNDTETNTGKEEAISA